MALSDSPVFNSGELSICPSLGQVTNIENDTVRLGPVNMKVLAALLERAGQVVTRSELFEAVWGNQVVGEDALTRCISDIRAELKKLSGREDLIETLPKRGYRWMLEVRESAFSVDGQQAATRNSESFELSQAEQRPRRKYFRLATRGLTYLLALAFMASTGVWLADRMSNPGLPVVAMLPVASQSDNAELAMLVENALIERLIELGNVELLSRSAVASRPENPFPFFFYEFGARWVIEAQLQHLSGRDVLMMAVVDARTGIVLVQQSDPISTAPPVISESISRTVQALEPFFESQTSGNR
jgi:DNA-binding winged helix-turn-helix (wHTH) protein